MSSTTVSNSLKQSVIESLDDHDKCAYCGGRIGTVNDLKACVDCHTTPSGNYIEAYDESNVDSDWPYTRCGEENEKRDAYSSYSVRVGRKRVKLNGGYEEAYRDPENGVDYCIDPETYESNPHHESLIIWYQ